VKEAIAEVRGQIAEVTPKDIWALQLAASVFHSCNLTSDLCNRAPDL